MPTPGQTLLHYRLVEKIGEGGMGVVWKAIDTTLDRAVAIKLLPETIAADEERLRRFENEARSLAALNHPGIAAIYGLHRAEGGPFIAMELVGGQDLAQRLKHGPLSVNEAVAVTMAIADALSAAHASGVVHRDLKPGNVMLTVDGVPKVLDFGLAKAMAPDASMSGSGPTSAQHSPTVTSFGTVAGVILGTAAYMSPEQARGRPVDRRADLWALGAMLYEMLTGKAPFAGETISDTLASVLKEAPDFAALPADTPAAVRRLLRRCLEKDPRNRLHDAADARIELAHAFDDDEVPAVAARSRRAPLVTAALVTLAAVVGGLLGFMLRGEPAPRPSSSPIVSDILTPPGVTLDVNDISLAFSPDGQRLAFVGVDENRLSHLYIRRLDSSEARRLEQTVAARTPFWSPDGRELGYHSGTRMLRIPVDGGAPQLIADRNGLYGAWHPDGTILFASRGDGPLLRVDAGGGPVEVVAGTDIGPGISALSPHFIPDSRKFTFQVQDLGGGTQGIYLGELGSTEVTRLTDEQWNAVYAEGHLLTVRDDMLVAERLDLEAQRLTGEARRLAGPVLRLNYPFHGFFSVAPRGERLAFLHGEQAADLAELVWVDRSGTELGRPGIRGDLYNPRLSKDGRRLAIDVSTSETHGDIWIFDLARGSSRRLTQHPLDESKPIWSPDNSRVLFFRLPDLYEIDAAGGSEATPILTSPNQKVTSDISPDGRWLLFSELTANDHDIRVLDLQSGEVGDWLGTEFRESNARYSPDGQWVAYESTESGDGEVYVDRFPARGERFRVSSGGGFWPVWRRDGKELFYVSGTGDLMAVAVKMDSEHEPIGRPEKLFSPHLRRTYFDVTADGQRFLLVQRVDPKVHSISLIQNWSN